MPSLVTLLTPWEFSPTVLLACIAAAVLSWRGLRRRRQAGLRTDVGRTLSFYTGLVLIYGVMQTYVDYLSRHMFWVHRVQHLVLHHLGAFLIMLAVPHEVLDPRPPHQHGSLGFPVRIVMLWAIMLPQIAIGAHIANSKTVLYDVYSVCGCAWPMSPLVDQTTGGVVTWIPAAMMSVLAILLVLRLWMQQSAREEAVPGPVARMKNERQLTREIS